MIRMGLARAGLYVREDQLTVAVSSGRGRPIECFTLEPGEVPGARLKSELDSRQIRARRMRIGLARSLVTVKVIEVPAASGSQLAEMVTFELERHVPFPSEEMRFDFAVLPGSRDAGQRVLIAACERRTVDSALKLLEESRLKPGALTAACHDLPSLLARGQRPRLAIWAHRAAGSTDLVCLSQGRLAMSRTVPIKDGDELADEVAATLHLMGWESCDAVWVSGDSAADFLSAPALREVASAVGEPVWKPAVRPLIEGRPEEDRGGAMLALAVALGSRRPVLNLLPQELRPRTLSSEQLITAGTVTITALLGLGLLVGQGYQQHRYANRLSNAIRALDPEVKVVEGLSAQVAQKKRLLETIQALEHNDVRALPILKELTERIPPEAWLRTLTMDKQGIEITGQASAANQLIPLLENSPLLTRVEFTAPVTKAGDKEQFRIKAAWKNAPKAQEAAPAKAPSPTPPARGGAPRAPQPGAAR